MPSDAGCRYLPWHQQPWRTKRPDSSQSFKRGARTHTRASSLKANLTAYPSFSTGRPISTPRTQEPGGLPPDFKIQALPGAQASSDCTALPPASPGEQAAAGAETCLLCMNRGAIQAAGVLHSSERSRRSTPRTLNVPYVYSDWLVASAPIPACAGKAYGNSRTHDQNLPSTPAFNTHQTTSRSLLPGGRRVCKTRSRACLDGHQAGRLTEESDS